MNPITTYTLGEQCKWSEHPLVVHRYVTVTTCYGSPDIPDREQVLELPLLDARRLCAETITVVSGFYSNVEGKVIRVAYTPDKNSRYPYLGDDGVLYNRHGIAILSKAASRLVKEFNPIVCAESTLWDLQSIVEEGEDSGGNSASIAAKLIELFIADYQNQDKPK